MSETSAASSPRVPAAQDAALALVELVEVEIALRTAVAQEGDDPLALFLARTQVLHTRQCAI
jgi:hypothetical protein